MNKKACTETTLKLTEITIVNTATAILANLIVNIIDGNSFSSSADDPPAVALLLLLELLRLVPPLVGAGVSTSNDAGAGAGADNQLGASDDAIFSINMFC